jgi:sporulation protein YlmC with PRC-barrel domain
MRKNTFWMAAMAMVGAGSIYAADVEVKTKVDTDKPKVEAEVKKDTDKRDYRQEARVESAVKANHKASHIIGMEVRNRNDERLGEVKDVVLDLQNGKVGYVAMAVGGGILGVGEKLVAIPATAFTPSENRSNVLILDATRGEITDAPGFASTNWPDPRRDMNESPFWRPKSRGSAAESETGRAKLYTEPDRGRVETKIEKK